MSDQEFFKKWGKYCDTCVEYRPANHKHCPKCNSGPEDHELRNYSMMWHEGDIYCLKCGEYVRMWDAG